LRKKKHVGEFQQLGFYAYVYLRADLDESIVDLLQDTMHGDIESEMKAPAIGAFWGQSYFELFICPLRGSATSYHQDWLRARLRNDINVDTYDIGPLIDAWREESFQVSTYEPHRQGPWTKLNFPKDRCWWKRGQPPGWRAIILWTRQQMIIRALLDQEQQAGSNIAD
jgi:uncharacterized protein YggL (DUF469 family)